MNKFSVAVICSAGAGVLLSSCTHKTPVRENRPNILIAISDDQSFAHTSFAGCRFVNTPGLTVSPGPESFSPIAGPDHPVQHLPGVPW
jgi:hypothetical protein